MRNTELRFRSEQADQVSEQLYYDLRGQYDSYREYKLSHSVSRSRYRTLLTRILEYRVPYGVQTLAYRSDGAILLVHHDEVNQWVLPGGQPTSRQEPLKKTAKRELQEEADITGEYEGLALLFQVRISHGQHQTQGILPVFRAVAASTDCHADDPDDEITAAKWFHSLPENTRDREYIQAYQQGLQK